MDDNVTSTFKAMFAEANRLSQSERFVEADDLCFRLLRRPTLPLLYRAGCNLLLSFGEDHPVEHAEEAVKWYNLMYNEIRHDATDGPHHRALLEQALDALKDAKQRAAEVAEAVNTTDEEGGDDHEPQSEESQEEEEGRGEQEGHDVEEGHNEEEGSDDQAEDAPPSSFDASTAVGTASSPPATQTTQVGDSAPEKESGTDEGDEYVSTQ